VWLPKALWEHMCFGASVVTPYPVFGKLCPSQQIFNCAALGPLSHRTELPTPTPTPTPTPRPAPCSYCPRRFATALTVISMLVVVLCQFDPESGESRATDTFYGTRILEVSPRGQGGNEGGKGEGKGGG
jgi:hypothetical protein